MAESGAKSGNVDQSEISKFEQLADQWWDPNGDFRTLHVINPVRCNWINARAPVAGKTLLDVGCGGGLLTEKMHQLEAKVTGIDMGEAPLNVARQHSLAAGADITYLQTSAEELAASQPASFDIVTCLEVLEHVPDPSATVAACASLAKAGGSLFFSTLNRNAKSWLLAILGGEYILKLLPKGTHRYDRFIRPSQLASWCRDAGLVVSEIQGMHYNPLNRSCSFSQNCDVNYFMCCIKPKANEA